MPHAIGMLLNLQSVQKLVAQVKSVDGMRDNLLRVSAEEKARALQAAICYCYKFQIPL